MKKKFGTMIAAVILGLGMFAASPAPNANAATCYGATCEGKDPQAAGCSTNSFTSTSFPWGNPSVLVELRINSSVCMAGWVRFTGSCSGSGCFGVQAQSRRWVNDRYYYSYSRWVQVGGTGWTTMLDWTGNIQIRACNPFTCTSWR